MRLHVNIFTLLGGIVISGIGLIFVGPVVVMFFIASELYRCHLIAILTSDVSANTILEFDRGDRDGRYDGAHSTMDEIRKFSAISKTSKKANDAAPIEPAVAR